MPFDKFLFTLWARSFHEPAAVIAATPPPADSPKHPQSSHNSFHLGWLPLEKLASFKRMQPYLASPPEGLASVDGIAEVVKPSTLVDVQKFGEDGAEGAGWYVRRKSDLSRPEDALQRSVYVKGFPATEKDGETPEERDAIKAKELELQQKLEQWANALELGKIASLRMRREDRAGVNGKPALKGKGRFKVRPSVFSLSLRTAALTSGSTGIDFHRVRRQVFRRQVPRSRPETYFRRCRARDQVEVRPDLLLPSSLSLVLTCWSQA